MYKKILLTIMIFSFIFIPNAQAVTIYNCTADYVTTNITAIQNGNYREIFYNNISCNGLECADNGLECNSNQNVDPVLLLAIGVVLGLVAFVFGYLSVAMADKHYPLQLVFLGVSILTLITDLAILLGAFTYTQSGLSVVLAGHYTLLMWMFYFFVAYSVLMIIIEILRSFEKLPQSWSK